MMEDCGRRRHRDLRDRGRRGYHGLPLHCM